MSCYEMSTTDKIYNIYHRYTKRTVLLKYLKT